jgi:hypothetical protein
MRASGGQSTRSRGQAESPSLDLPIGHHLSGGLQRSSSESSSVVARRCSRQREREGEDDAGERGGATGRADRATWSGSIDQVGWRRQVGLARQVGQGWQRKIDKGIDNRAR